MACGVGRWRGAQRIMGRVGREEETSTELANRLMADMDPALLAFLRNQVDSFIKWDLIHFFHDNPHTTDTAVNIARYIGRDPNVTQAELSELVAGGVLTRRTLGAIVVYSLSPEPAVRERMRRFVEACGDRGFRVRAIYHVIRRIR